MRAKSPVKKQAHGQLVKQVREILELDGWRTVGIRAGAFSEKGIFDIYADRWAPKGIESLALWVECKVGKDKLSPAQEEFKKARDASGIINCVVRRLEDLKDMGILSGKVKL